MVVLNPVLIISTIWFILELDLMDFVSVLHLLGNGGGYCRHYGGLSCGESGFCSSSPMSGFPLFYQVTFLSGLELQTMPGLLFRPQVYRLVALSLLLVCAAQRSKTWGDRVWGSSLWLARGCESSISTTTADTADPGPCELLREGNSPKT